ncbi:RNA polymerase sigma factor [Pseudomarimonas arenosa]|uniref:Sigma-70 family RNA polymerase sigma factor n=1 Tax=Pseudomarimonas arenosa TaxID=2774145 RepID=A0AAW3ZRA8_9GAMM|nr:sigma-70 family RNA polymerase sigma factor [Pseudomarimonas arenosa]MBD8527144.1 sigma-70 family RNA polymerase sigma factor [Pseudomarimonas arenosa]
MSDPESAFAEMLQHNRAALSRLARHYAAPQDVPDLMQEIHLQLWRSFDRFEGRSERSTWVYRVALNTALSFRRQPTPLHQSLDSVAESADAGGALDEMQLLEAFLAGLDPVQRALLLLDLEGLSRGQVAEVLGLSENAVAVRMTRLRQRFEAQFLEHV